MSNALLQESSCPNPKLLWGLLKMENSELLWVVSFRENLEWEYYCKLKTLVLYTRCPTQKKKKEKEKSTLLKISLAINCLCIVVPAVRIAVWNTNLIRVTAIKWKELNECLKSALLQVLCLLFWRQTVSMLWVPSARSQKSVVLIFMEVINFFFFFPSSPSSCG